MNLFFVSKVPPLLFNPADGGLLIPHDQVLANTFSFVCLLHTYTLLDFTFLLRRGVSV